MLYKNLTVNHATCHLCPWLTCLPVQLLNSRWMVSQELRLEQGKSLCHFLDGHICKPLQCIILEYTLRLRASFQFPILEYKRVAKDYLKEVSNKGQDEIIKSMEAQILQGMWVKDPQIQKTKIRCSKKNGVLIKQKEKS